jgi:hypothetical protein
LTECTILRPKPESDMYTHLKRLTAESLFDPVLRPRSARTPPSTFLFSRLQFSNSNWFLTRVSPVSFTLRKQQEETVAPLVGRAERGVAIVPTPLECQHPFCRFVTLSLPARQAKIVRSLNLKLMNAFARARGTSHRTD